MIDLCREKRPAQREYIKIKHFQAKWTRFAVPKMRENNELEPIS
jgi:hypothetical protein